MKRAFQAEPMVRVMAGRGIGRGEIVAECAIDTRSPSSALFAFLGVFPYSYNRREKRGKWESLRIPPSPRATFFVELSCLAIILIRAWGL